MGDLIQFIPRAKDGGKARILRRRNLAEPITDHRDELVMDHADNGTPSDSPYTAPDGDCA